METMSSNPEYVPKGMHAYTLADLTLLHVFRKPVKKKQGH